MFNTSLNDDPFRDKIKKLVEFITTNNCTDIFGNHRQWGGAYVSLTEIKSYNILTDKFDGYKAFQLSNRYNIKTGAIIAIAETSSDVMHHRVCKINDNLTISTYRLVQIIGTRQLFYVLESDLQSNVLKRMPKRELIESRLVKFDEFLSSGKNKVNEENLKKLHWLLTPEASESFEKLSKLKID